MFAGLGTDPLLILTDRGLYCPAGGFHIDPWAPVERAVITHAHSDHARPGSRQYLCAADGAAILADRTGGDSIHGLQYGDSIRLGDIDLSLHPAGHILGSAQVRLERQGQVWVVSGDYKLENDGISRPFEPLRCHVFISECTFGLPIYRWVPQPAVLDQINQWWRTNQQEGFTSILYAYALGKSQRIVGGVDASIGPILTHGAMEKPLERYRQAGVPLPPTLHADEATAREHRGRALVIAPSSADNSPWLRKFAPVRTAIASGWMQVRGPRRRAGVDRGFVLSDHADFFGLLEAIRLTGASHVGLTHGQTHAMARYLSEKGLATRIIPTRFAGEDAEEAA